KPLAMQGSFQHRSHRAYVIERLVGVDFADRCTHCARERGKIGGRLDNHRHRVLSTLLIGPIDLWQRVSVDPLVTEMTHDTHNLDPRPTRYVDSKPFADRAFNTEHLSREPVVDDANCRPV